MDAGSPAARIAAIRLEKDLAAMAAQTIHASARTDNSMPAIASRLPKVLCGTRAIVKCASVCGRLAP